MLWWLRRRCTLWGRHPGRILHDLLWNFSPATYRQRRADRLLHLGDSHWLFISGLNHSGTTVLDALLCTHPGIRGLGTEGQMLTMGLPTGSSAGVPSHFTHRLSSFRRTEHNDPALLLRARYDWAWHFRNQEGIPAVRSPHNSMRLRWLEANFAPSRFLVVVRHPYAVCEGLARRQRIPIETAALHWKLGNEILIADFALLGKAKLIYYEELCADPAATLEQVRELLELEEPFDSAVAQQRLRVHNIDRKPMPLASLNARSVERLSTTDIEVIDRVAGELMDRLGYQRLGRAAGPEIPSRARPLL